MWILLLIAIIFLMCNVGGIGQLSKGEKASKKGKVGERKVSKLLRNLDETYTSYHDLYIEKKDGNMTQLDHVVISKYGIFVIETKNFAGWIFGEERQRNWTQVLYRKKSRFYNPIMQNKAHIKALTAHLQMERNVFSLIVFSNAVTFKFKEEFTDVKVLKMNQLLQVIKNHKKVLFTQRQVEIMNNRMSSLRGEKRKEKIQIKNEHLDYVREVQKNVENNLTKKQMIRNPIKQIASNSERKESLENEKKLAVEMAEELLRMKASKGLTQSRQVSEKTRKNRETIVSQGSQKGKVVSSEKFDERCSEVSRVYQHMELQSELPTEIVKQSMTESLEMKKYQMKVEERVSVEREICPKCGNEMLIKRGEYGSFYGCSNYPTCRSTKKIRKNESKISKKGGNK